MKQMSAMELFDKIKEANIFSYRVYFCVQGYANKQNAWIITIITEGDYKYIISIYELHLVVEFFELSNEFKRIDASMIRKNGMYEILVTTKVDEHKTKLKEVLFHIEDQTCEAIPPELFDALEL